MAVDAAHRIGRDEVVWAFSPDLTPVLEIDPGETVTLETNDCFSGQIASEADLVTEIDFSRVNSATGPIAVRGAEPGDSLVVELLQVRTEAQGFATLIPGIGQLNDQVSAPLTQVFRVDGDVIHMTDRISFPLRPMVGVIGVATESDTVSNGFAGEHGGNLDNHLHGPGATVYLPVRQPGGMLAIGDMHASMGDGEVCFTGVEIAGEVTIRVGLLKGKQGRWPVTELADELGRARDRRARLHGGARPRGRRGCTLPRRPVGLHDRRGVRLPVGRVRREHLPGVPAAGILDDRARFNPQGVRDTETVFVAE